MIDLYSWNTSNGRKVAIMLEELGLPYTFHPVDISKGEQFAPQFLAISPNNKIPALVDSDGPGGEPISVFESGAILIYLAEKMGSALWPADVRTRMEVLQWLMVQIGGVGPMFGQALHFKRYADTTIPYAIKRYGEEVDRLCLVLDGRLADHEFLAGAFSIADIATYPWIDRGPWLDLDWARYPNLKRWFDAISARPAVQGGLAAQDVKSPRPPDQGLVQTWPFEEIGAVARTNGEGDALAVAAQGERDLDTGRAKRPNAAEHRRNIEHRRARHF